MALNPRDEELQIKTESIEIHFDNSENTESLYSSYKLEVSEDNGKMNGVAAELDNDTEDSVLEDLIQASKSLSQISVQDEEALDCDVNQETLFDLENAGKLSENKSSSKDYTLATNDLIKDTTIEAERNSSFDPLDDCDEDSDLFLRISSLHQDTHQISEIDEPPTQKRMKLTDKILSGKTTNFQDSWDTDFPSETELQKMVDSLRQPTQQNLDESSFNFNGKKGEMSKKFEVNYKGITERVTKRKRHILDLVNKVNEASCYLDRVGKALAAAPSSVPVIIPPPPKFNGYDKQFDFPERRRYSKLPITIETVGSKRNDSEKSSFLKPQSTSSFNKHQSIKEMFSGGNGK